MSFRVVPGFASEHRQQVARLFWAAFQEKLRPSLGDEASALAFIERGLRPDFAFSAVDAQGNLLGAAGIKTGRGGFLTGTFKDLRDIYGLWGAIWRGTVLDQFERKLTEDVLQMDGIFVDEVARGQGVGTALLDAVMWTAQMNRCSQVRLDVVSGNPRARVLYERYGFKEVSTYKAGILAPLLGFTEATTMMKPVDPAPTKA